MGEGTGGAVKSLRHRAESSDTNLLHCGGLLLISVSPILRPSGSVQLSIAAIRLSGTVASPPDDCPGEVETRVIGRLRRRRQLLLGLIGPPG